MGERVEQQETGGDRGLRQHHARVAGAAAEVRDVATAYPFRTLHDVHPGLPGGQAFRRGGGSSLSADLVGGQPGCLPEGERPAAPRGVGRADLVDASEALQCADLAQALDQHDLLHTVRLAQGVVSLDGGFADEVLLGRAGVLRTRLAKGVVLLPVDRLTAGRIILAVGRSRRPLLLDEFHDVVVGVLRVVGQNPLHAHIGTNVVRRLVPQRLQVRCDDAMQPLTPRRDGQRGVRDGEPHRG